jgi:predicted nucleotidyltransferase
MTPTDFDELMNAIGAVRPQIEEQYPIRLIGVFGSVARGEERPDSDVDILIEAGPGLSLFKLGAATTALERALGRPVDLILEGALNDRVRLRVSAELRTL